jgi:hypothetical protein
VARSNHPRDGADLTLDDSQDFEDKGQNHSSMISRETKEIDELERSRCDITFCGREEDLQTLQKALLSMFLE